MLTLPETCPYCENIITDIIISHTDPANNLGSYECPICSYKWSGSIEIPDEDE